MQLDLTHKIEPEIEGDAHIDLTLSRGEIWIEKDKTRLVLSSREYLEIRKVWIKYEAALKGMNE